MTFKKALLASAIVIASGFNVVQAADPSATVTWTGLVSDSVAGDDLIITGLGGVPFSTQTPKGVLSIKGDGSFTSTQITLESHEYDSVGETIGDLHNANWTVSKVQYVLGGNVVSGPDAEMLVMGNGTEYALGTEGAAAESSISFTVSSATDLSGKYLVRGEGQVGVTVVAKKKV